MATRKEGSADFAEQLAKIIIGDTQKLSPTRRELLELELFLVDGAQFASQLIDKYAKKDVNGQLVDPRVAKIVKEKKLETNVHADVLAEKMRDELRKVLKGQS